MASLAITEIGRAERSLVVMARGTTEASPRGCVHRGDGLGNLPEAASGANGMTSRTAEFSAFYVFCVVKIDRVCF